MGLCLGLLVLLVLALLMPSWNRAQRRRALAARFGPQIADRIMRREVWQGATLDMLFESRGQPVEVREHVLKHSVKRTFCYSRIAKNRYALKVHTENGVVIGWDA